MTVVDALVVVLGLDAKELEAKSPAAVKKLNELDKSAEKTEKHVAKISKTSKETSRSVEGLSRTVGSLLAVIGGTVALKNFFQDFVDTNAQLDRLSKNLGLSVSTISAWSNASEKLGGSAQGLQGTLDMLSKSQTQLMITGESNLIPYFSALGVSLAGVNGQARPVTDILLDLADRFSHLGRTEANNLGRMMGLDQGTLNLLLRGRKELELEISRQKEQTAVTAAQAAQAQKFQTQIAGLKQHFMALGRSLLMDAAPYIEKLFNLFERFLSWAQDHQQFIEDFLKVMAVGLGAIALATAPINLTVTAIIALGAAIALLWDDYQTWKKGGDSLIDWGKWEPGIEAATRAVIALGNGIKDTYGWIIKLHDAIPDSWARAVQSVAAKVGFRPAEDEISKPKSSKGGIQGALDRLMSNTGGSISDQAKQLAQQVSQQTGIPADIIFAQWQHETGGFSNRGATKLNNLAGINVPGGKGEDYRNFDSLQDFGTYYSQLIQSKYPGAMGSQTAEQFASALKVGGYYAAPESEYAGGINRFLAQDRSPYASSMMGIPGAANLAQSVAGSDSGRGTTVDRSVKTDIGTVIVNTQATDAFGIASDMSRALDYQFVSQANYGLN